jgi:hypothetical protein
MKLDVGQIVYILSRKDKKVYPAVVIEEICRKTIEEKVTSYVIRLPDKGKTETLLEDIDADYFVSIEEAEREMKKNAEDQINKILDTARKMESVFDGFIVKKNVPERDEPLITEPPLEPLEPGADTITEEDTRVMVDLGNGIRANFDPRTLGV